MSTKQEIPDGIYFLFPGGGAWVAVQFRSGHIDGQTEECLAEIHQAAGDRWAGIAPAESDDEVVGALAIAVLVLAMPDAQPELVLVSRQAAA